MQDAQQEPVYGLPELVCKINCLTTLEKFLPKTASLSKVKGQLSREEM